MKIKFIKTYNVIITALLSILGFATSCESKAEYGSPSATFIINGDVKSSETNEPIKNIRIKSDIDTVYTDNEGKYQLKKIGAYPGDRTFYMQFTDIDGADNEDFNELDTIVEFKDPQFTGGDGDWYEGETSKEFDIKLDPK